MSEDEAPNATRARLGCLVCRSRKVRCDKTLPSCRKCVNLGVRCPGYNLGHGSVSRQEMLESTNDIFRAAGVEKRRVGSCEECRVSKSRCSRTRPTCQRCAAKSLTCVYRARVRDKEDTSASPSSPLTLQECPKMILGLDSRLWSETLPEDVTLRAHLVNTYFDRVHHLRCLAFIHKPSFMHSMACASVVQDYGEPLLLIMCALGARCIFIDQLQATSQSKPAEARLPGENWADKARRMVLEEMHLPSVHQAMTMILLCEYGLRTEQHSLVFILSGCIFRTIRLLGLDIPPRESEEQPTSLEKEINNRLVWSCYTLDVLLASGVDKNSSWRNDVPSVALPSSDKDFLLRVSTTPQYLEEIEASSSFHLVSQSDLPTIITILARLRCKVLRLIRATTSAQIKLWDPESPFLSLLRQLDAFYENLPERFHITDLNTYIHKDQHTLGVLFYLHFMYNAAIFDLTRISLAGFSFPLAEGFQDSPAEFRTQCQERCHFHANVVSDLIHQGFAVGRMAFDDMFCADVALESAKIQIIHSATVGGNAQAVEKTRQNLKTILQLLVLQNVGKSSQSTYIRALLPLCVLFGFRDIADEWRESQSPHRMSPEVTGSADIHHLTYFAPFRRARSEIRAHQSSTSPGTVSSFNTQGSWTSGLANRERPPINAIEPIITESPQLQQAHESSLVATSQHPISTGEHLHPHQPQQQIGEVAPDLTMFAPSMEDYIRTAGEMSDYLTWNMYELPDLPLWTDFEPQDPSNP